MIPERPLGDLNSRTAARAFGPCIGVQSPVWLIARTLGSRLSDGGAWGTSRRPKLRGNIGEKSTRALQPLHCRVRQPSHALCRIAETVVTSIGHALDRLAKLPTTIVGSRTIDVASGGTCDSAFR